MADLEDQTVQEKPPSGTARVKSQRSFSRLLEFGWTDSAARHSPKASCIAGHGRLLAARKLTDADCARLDRFRSHSDSDQSLPYRG